MQGHSPQSYIPCILSPWVNKLYKSLDIANCFCDFYSKLYNLTTGEGQPTPVDRKTKSETFLVKSSMPKLPTEAKDAIKSPTQHRRENVCSPERCSWEMHPDQTGFLFCTIIHLNVLPHSLFKYITPS